MTSDDPFEQVFQHALEQRRTLGLDRQRIVVEHFSATHVRIDGQTLVNFCSNDYLGLTRHPKIVAAMARASTEYGTGAGASALISGYTPAHASAERAIVRWKGTESAVLLPSGYQANHAAIQTIAGAAGASGRRVRFLLDKLVHASLLDAVGATSIASRGAGAQPFRVFPHNDLAKLQRLLAEADRDEMQVVVTESIFSMDGDAAPLVELVALKREHPFVLLLDEAHASGVYGTNGAGLANELNVGESVDATIVTLSKSLGLGGGAICARQSFCDAVANFGRAYIYSTALPPVLASAAEAALEVMRDEPDRRVRVRALARRVRDELAAAGVSILRGDSPIIPVVLGEERFASEAATRLRERGLLVMPVRPPTVRRGTSRLRVTLSSAHTDDEIATLIDALNKLAGTNAR